MTAAVEAAVGAALHDEWGRIVAALIERTGDWDLAEVCAEDAFAAALEQWPRAGIPPRPGAWLASAARDRAGDRLRRSTTDGERDDRLPLIFSCCHPALALESRVALTLRTLAGRTPAEIARAFVVAEPAIVQRLARAKQKIRNAGIPHRVPPAHLLPKRTGAVLGVLHLLFNEGHSADPNAEPARRGLSGDAIRLARVFVGLMPGEAEATGLLALMLLHDARGTTHVDATGALIPLERQDRARWDAGEIAEGVALLQDTAERSHPGPYRLQAAIAACHATAAGATDTDWPRIASLYGELARCMPSPVVELNRAVAVGMAAGPSAGLALVEALEASGELAGYHLLPATRADLLRRLDRASEAADAYREALILAATDAERRSLERRLAEVTRSSVARLG